MMPRPRRPPVGAVTVNALGTIAPGTSPAILNAGSTTFNGGTLAVELDSAAAGTGYDQVNVTGGVTLATDSTLTISLGFDPVDGVDFFTIVNNDLAESVSIATLLGGLGFLAARRRRKN